MNPWQWWRNRTRRENELDEEIQSHLRMSAIASTAVRHQPRRAPMYGASLAMCC